MGRAASRLQQAIAPEAASERLQKALASAGLGSRREMEEWIAEGRVQVNGETATIGSKVGPSDIVKVSGRRVYLRFDEKRTRILIYHKSEGEIVTRDDPKGRATVFDALPKLRGAKWIAIGRLDYNTDGLMIFTTSGELANNLMHPRFEVEREYAVRVLGELTEDMIAQLLAGVELDDGPAQLQSCFAAGGEGANRWYRVVIKEGRKREVRRLFEHFGLTVSRLTRIRFGPIALPPQLRRGQKMELDDDLVARVLEWAGHGAQPAPADARRAGQAHAQAAHVVEAWRVHAGGATARLALGGRLVLGWPDSLLSHLFDHTGGPLAATQAKGQRKGQADRAKADLERGGEQIGPDLELFQRHEHHEDNGRVFRQRADGERALHTDVVEVGEHHAVDEACHQHAEHQHQDGDDDIGDVEHHLVEQLGHHVQAKTVGHGDDDDENDDPVGQLGQQLRQRHIQIALLEEGLDAGFFGEHVEFQHVEQFQHPGAHKVGEQPADEQQQQRCQQLRHKACELRPEGGQGSDKHIELLLHGMLLHLCGKAHYNEPYVQDF
ncbi:MAG: pseudouridine synthase [Burkholderiaceae bacterium]|nr:pseudouridine synthase [Burkholderiaceae bacterium]